MRRWQWLRHPTTSRLVNNAIHAVNELWLRVLEQLAARAAHELKGALNGVAVNLEVVRSRAAKVDAPATAVASFATTAAGQLEAVVEMTAALLGLARPPRELVDVAETVTRIVALLRPAALTEGFTIDVVDESPPGGLVLTGGAERGYTVRLAVASALLAVMPRKRDLRCRLGRNDTEDAQVCIEWSDAGPPPVPESDIVDALTEGGVRVEITSQEIILVVPR